MRTLILILAGVLATPALAWDRQNEVTLGEMLILNELQLNRMQQQQQYRQRDRDIWECQGIFRSPAIPVHERSALYQQCLDKYVR